MLTLDYIDQHYYYNDGKLYSVDDKKKIGWTSAEGYRKCTINNETYYLHRIIFFMHHGYWPDLVDHIDRNKLNNDHMNLRDATKSMNGHNQGIRKNNKSGIKGVSLHKQTDKWRAQICIENRVIHLGLFNSVEEAGDAIKLFKEC